MNKAEKVKSWVLSRIGNPYIMGGTGAFCTVQYRQARAAQYPGSAAKIKSNCQRMSGKASSCEKCGYWDESAGNGKRAYDCAQLVRWAMETVGIKMVSGATSQWKKTAWQETGTIDSLPKDKLCLVYRDDGNGIKGHTGIYLGDGTVVHARGHDYGVVRQTLAQYARWTHWGIPAGLYDQDSPEQEEIMDSFEVTGKNLALRKGMSTNYEVLVRIPTGTVLQGTKAGAEWVNTTYDGKTGYCMAQYLRSTEPTDAADDEPENEPEMEPPDSDSEVSVTIPLTVAKALQEALKTATEGRE